MSLETTVGLYIGGQMDVYYQLEKDLYDLYRGEIERIAIENNRLLVRLKWNAKWEGYPSSPRKWVNDELLDYDIDISSNFCDVSEIGDRKFCLKFPITHETVILFPKDGSRLELSEVEGLDTKSV